MNTHAFRHVGTLVVSGTPREVQHCHLCDTYWIDGLGWLKRKEFDKFVSGTYMPEGWKHYNFNVGPYTVGI